MKQTINILDIPVANVSLTDGVNHIIASTAGDDLTQVAFVNADCLNIACKHPDYKSLLQSLPLVLGDGAGIRYASKMLGQPIVDNVNGTDLFPMLCESAARENLPIYFLGGKPGVVDKVIGRVQKRYPKLIIAGYCHGFFQPEDTGDVLEDIRDSGARLLLVAMGAPQQELWIHQHREELGALTAIGVGGLFDFAAKDVARAPMWVRSLGLEWTVRLLNEPLRLMKRYLLGNPLFLWRCYRQQATQLITADNLLEKVGEKLPAPIQRHFDIWKDFEILDEVETKFSSLANRRGFNKAAKSRRHNISKWLVKTRYFDFAKRVIDISGALTALLLLSPVFLLTAMAIRIESEGPILFKQVRVGRYGVRFGMLKFRSMVVNAEAQKSALINQNESAAGVIFKMKDDPRITRVGRFIRKYSIDELPQLINVLLGHMSLVGPRPPVCSEVDMYSVSDRRRLEVKPGITCIWQVSGRSNIDFIGQVKLDINYIRQHSIIEDIKILFKTIPAVLQNKGAY